MLDHATAELKRNRTIEGTHLGKRTTTTTWGSKGTGVRWSLLMHHEQTNPRYSNVDFKLIKGDGRTKNFKVFAWHEFAYQDSFEDAVETAERLMDEEDFVNP